MTTQLLLGGEENVKFACDKVLNWVNICEGSAGPDEGKSVVQKSPHLTTFMELT